MKFDQSNIQVDNHAVIRIYLNFGVEIRLCPNKSFKIFNYLDKSHKLCPSNTESITGSLPKLDGATSNGDKVEADKKRVYHHRPQQHRSYLLCAAYCTSNGYHTSIDHPSANIRYKGGKLDVTLPGAKRVVLNGRKNLIKFCHIPDRGTKSIPGQGVGLALGYTLDEVGIGFLFDHLPPMLPPPQSSFSSTSILGYDELDGAQLESGDGADTKTILNEDLEINDGDHMATTSASSEESQVHRAREERHNLQKRIILRNMRDSYEIVKKAQYHGDKMHKSTCILIGGFRIVQNNVSGELEIKDLLSLQQQIPYDARIRENSNWVICMAPCLNKIWIETSLLKISVESNGVVSIKNEDLKLDASPLRLTVNNQKFAAGFTLDGDLFLKKLR